VAGAELRTARHQRRAADGGKAEGDPLHARRPFARQPQAVSGESEAGEIAEQGRIAELGQPDSRMPRSKVSGEKEGGAGKRDGHLAAGPVHRLAHRARQQPEEGQSERQPPEAGGDGPGVSQAHQPRPERQRRIAEQQRRIGEAVGAGGIAHPLRLGASTARWKVEARKIHKPDLSLGRPNPH
jgi:hypothetical protein